jgi:N-methylhydantoinase A
VIPGVDVEILSWILALSAPAQGRLADASAEQPGQPKPLTRRLVFDPDRGEFIDTPVYWRADLAAGARIDGPAIIAEDETATVVGRNFDARIDRFGYIELRAREAT